MLTKIVRILAKGFVKLVVNIVRLAFFFGVALWIFSAMGYFIAGRIGQTWGWVMFWVINTGFIVLYVRHEYKKEAKKM